MKQNKKIPTLRFPEFSGEWEVKKLGDICNGINSGNTKPEIEGFYPVYGSTGIIGKSENYTHNGKYLLIARVGANAGRINQVTDKFSVTDNTLILSFEKEIVIDFLYFLLLQINLNKLVFGSGQPLITGGQLKSLNITVSSVKEQQKIADFLTQIDNRIEKLTKKKELLEKYKKGVMQKIFNQEIRFKNDKGEDYSDWEFKELGEIAEVKRGLASQHLNYVNDENEGIRLLRINDFLNDDAVYIKETESTKELKVKTNDLLIAGTGATAGIIFIVPEKFNNLPFSYNAPRIRSKNSNHKFIYYYLKSDIIIKQQKRLFVGNAQSFLDTNAMRSFMINLPCLEEQQKIANFLTEIDKKINLTEKQLNGTKQYKKGLLQQMFI